MKRTLLILFLVALAAAGFGAKVVVDQAEAIFATPMSSVDSLEVLTVARGSSLNGVLASLADRGLVADLEAAKLATRYRRWRKLPLPMPKAGEYEIHTNWSLLALLEHLASGREKTYSVTVPEGLRIAEIIDRLGRSELLDAKVLRRLTRDPAIADELGLPKLPRRVQGHPNAERFEGWLFPTTYTITRAITEKALLKRMVGETRRVLDEPAIRAKAEALGWSPVQVLSMASVVEKETGKASERPIISGVFHNRLRQGIRLETDPTIIYGIVGYDGNIRRKHIRMPHPWNCYVHHGLPATPIAAPGREAIEAAVNPAKTDAIFFVSRNDGSHVFCPTLRCHRAAVDKWQVQYFRNKKRR